MLKSDIRGADYRAKAELAMDAARSSPLVQVQRKHEAAAAVWLDLAAFEDRRGAHAAHIIALGRPDRGPQEEDADGQRPEEIEPRSPQAQAAQGEGGPAGALVP